MIFAGTNGYLDNVCRSTRWRVRSSGLLTLLRGEACRDLLKMIRDSRDLSDDTAAKLKSRSSLRQELRVTAQPHGRPRGIVPGSEDDAPGLARA